MDNHQRAGFARTAVRGTAVRYLIFFSSKLLLFVSTTVLARLLTKDEMGVVGFAITTINFLDVISSMGMRPALIFYPESEKTSSTAFWASLITSFGVFGIAWLIAPGVALYFRDPRATDVIRILSIAYPISAVGDIYHTLLSKRLAFERTFLPEFLRAMSKGLSSIILAFAGFGAWSVIIGQICGEVVATIGYFSSLSWRPSFLLERTTLKALLNYGIKYVGADIVSIMLLNLDYLLVGRYLGTEALGIYILAFRLPDLIILQFARSLSTVIFPIYSRMREVPGNMAKGFLMTSRYVSLITVPLGLGLALVAKPFTQIVFTEKWIDAVPVIQGIAVYALFMSLAYNVGGAYKASGRPQINTWTGLFRLAWLMPSLWWAVTAAKSIVAVSWMHALAALAGTILNTFIATRMLSLSLKDMGKAFLPSIMSGLIMAGAVMIFLALNQDSGSWIQLVGGVLLGGFTYTACLWLFHREVVLDGFKIIRGSMNKGE